MEIVWHGLACFRLKSRDIAIVADPYDSKATGLSLGRPAADVVTISHKSPEHDMVTAVGGDPKVIDGPGEYEIRGTFITGIQTFLDDEGGKKRGKNVVYLYELDDVIVCHLGDLGHPLTAQQAEAMSSVDVLLVPVGSARTINTAQAAEVISLIEPKITVPMHYRAENADAVERFCRELGVPVPAAQPKLAVTRGALPEESQIVVLEQRRA